MDTPAPVTVIITADAGEHAPALNINGQTFPLVFNTPFELPDFAYAALKESTYGPATTLVSPPDPDPAQVGDGDGAAAATPSVNGGTETQIEPVAFNPDDVIAGTIKQVAERLSALTADELAAVEAAENDREQARKGVLEAIAAARAALETPPATPGADNQE